ncbi:MAG: WecB/TagA/CpsF family glycosyltransferase [Chitinophagales bacterium]|nr:WecB/TagA/CpsF family glycosyltransferase [Chitinophagales bacterium]
MQFKDAIQKIIFLNTTSVDTVATKLIDEWQQSNNDFILHFMYYASLELFRKEVNYQNSLFLANYILVDGIGMQSYFKLLMNKKMANLNGTDLSPQLINALLQKNIPIVFYGTTKEQINRCNDNLNKQYNKQVLHYFQDGFSDLNWEKIPNQAALFIGMGTPLQEAFVKENINIIKEKKLMVITVGGFFDFLSGFYVRAPKWIRQIKLEWLWRTLHHPLRHYKKRLRDTTIVFRPFLDKLNGIAKLIIIKEY